MCHRKEYDKRIQKYAEDILFRIIYASFPDFIPRYISNFKSIFPDTSFRERVLTQIEEQIIDVDAVAMELNRTLEDVLNEKVYVLNTAIDSCPFTVYVGSQFLALRIELNGKDISDAHIDAVTKILNTDAIKDNIEIVESICRTTHSLTAPSESDLGNVLDLPVFKGISAEITNSRYSDAYVYCGHDIVLTREMRDIICEGNKPGVYASILCLVRAEISNEYSTDEIKNIIGIAKQETTQCFRKNEKNN